MVNMLVVYILVTKKTHSCFKKNMVANYSHVRKHERQKANCKRAGIHGQGS
jgi:hypothetical protein